MNLTLMDTYLFQNIHLISDLMNNIILAEHVSAGKLDRLYFITYVFKEIMFCFF